MRSAHTGSRRRHSPATSPGARNPIYHGSSASPGGDRAAASSGAVADNPIAANTRPSRPGRGSPPTASRSPAGTCSSDMSIANTRRNSSAQPVPPPSATPLPGACGTRRCSSTRSASAPSPRSAPIPVSTRSSPTRPCTARRHRPPPPPAPPADGSPPPAPAPRYVTRCRRGRGTSTQPLHQHVLVITTAVVPSRHRFFSEYATRPSGSSRSRLSAIAAGPSARIPAQLLQSLAIPRRHHHRRVQREAVERSAQRTLHARAPLHPSARRARPVRLLAPPPPPPDPAPPRRRVLPAHRRRPRHRHRHHHPPPPASSPAAATPAPPGRAPLAPACPRPHPGHLRRRLLGELGAGALPASQPYTIQPAPGKCRFTRKPESKRCTNATAPARGLTTPARRAARS